MNAHMSGPEHFRAAEHLIAEADKITAEYDGTCPEAMRDLAAAQVHATLAVAAATALAAGMGHGYGSRDLEQWDGIAAPAKGRTR